MRITRIFRTNQCLVEVFDTGVTIEGYNVFMIKSYHFKSGKVNTRFGTLSQINGIVRTYHIDKEFML